MPSRRCCLCSKKSAGISYHSFPKDINGMNLWKKICDYEVFDDVSRLAICSRHFTADDYVNPSARQFGGRMQLKPGRCPSVKVPNKLPRSVKLVTPMSNGALSNKPIFKREIINGLETFSLIKDAILCEEPGCNEEIISGRVSPLFIDNSRLSELPEDIPEVEDPLSVNEIPLPDPIIIRKEFDLALEEFKKEKREQNALQQRKLRLLCKLKNLQETMNQLKENSMINSTKSVATNT